MQHIEATPTRRLKRGCNRLTFRQDDRLLSKRACVGEGAEKRNSDAIRELETCLSIDPNYVAAMNLLGLFYSFVGKPDAAASQVIKALERTGGRGVNETNLRNTLGFAYLLSARWEDAIENLERARTGQSASLSLRLGLAAAYAHKGATEAATAELGEALKIAPKLTIERLRTTASSAEPAYVVLREATLYDGLRKAGLAER